MSHRLQVLIPPDLDAQLTKAAKRNRMSKGEWVRRALKETLRKSSKVRDGDSALERLSALQGPAPNIEQMLAEIEAGRR